MSFLTRDWMRQRRNVNRLSRFVSNKKIEESRLRQEFGRRSHELFARIETMLMIGVTGAVWTSRLKDAEEPRPLRDLVLSVLIVRRWDRLAHWMSSKWGIEQDAETPATAAASRGDRSAPNTLPKDGG